MTSTSLASIDDQDLLAVSGGLNLTHIAEQGLNGAILGGAAGFTGGFAAGAFAGSIVPGMGTVAGAASGAVIGGVNGVVLGAGYGMYSEYKRQQRDGNRIP